MSHNYSDVQSESAKNSIATLIRACADRGDPLLRVGAISKQLGRELPKPFRGAGLELGEIVRELELSMGLVPVEMGGESYIDVAAWRERAKQACYAFSKMTEDARNGIDVSEVEECVMDALMKIYRVRPEDVARQIVELEKGSET